MERGSKVGGTKRKILDAAGILVMVAIFLFYMIAVFIFSTYFWDISH